MEGQGNITYASPSGGNSVAALSSANDGLSVTALVAKLGQVIGAAGDPAELTESREIPFNGNELFFGKDDGVSNSVGVSDNGIEQFTNNGLAYSAQFAVGANTTSLQIASPDGKLVVFTFAGSDTLNYDGTLKQLLSSIIFGAPAYNGNVIVQHTNVNPSFAWDNNTDTLVYDTATANGAVTIVPANFVGRKGQIKKMGTDLNTITITPSTGFVYGAAGPVNPFVFSGPGESISFHCDGANLYII